jgi:hypothetical protein
VIVMTTADGRTDDQNIGYVAGYLTAVDIELTGVLYRRPRARARNRTASALGLTSYSG